MPFTISNLESNKITIENTDLEGPMEYSLLFLDDDDFFSPVEGQTLETIPAGETVEIDLLNDNIYKIVIPAIDEESEDTTFYFLLDYNIKACEKETLQKVLCDPCETSDKNCNLRKHIDNVYAVTKFNIIKNNLYFIYNKYVQSQSFSDLIVPPNGELLYLSDLQEKLSLLCNGCKPNRGCGPVKSYPKTGCGC